MQHQPTDISSIIPSTESPEHRDATTQDGFSLPAPSLLDGRPQPRSLSLSPRSIATDTGLSTPGVGADELDETLRELSVEEGHASVPGERISAYENAAIPTGQQNSLFRVVKRSGPPHGGASLTDCPNGTLVLTRYGQSRNVADYLQNCSPTSCPTSIQTRMDRSLLSPRGSIPS